MDSKKHYKMYKSGKKWCYAAIATVSVALGAFAANGVTVQADTTANANAQSAVSTTTSTTTSDSLANSTSATTNATSAATSNTTAQAATTTSANTTASTTTQTWEPTTTNLQAPQSSDTSNNGSLDSVSVADGTLTVSGWNASNQDYGKDYHYIIVYDQTQGKELARQAVQNTQRTDVENAYPNIYNAEYSGFTASFNINSSDYLNDTIQIISRYSNQADGEGDYADLWFSPVTFKNQSTSSLESVSNNGDGSITVSGTDANNQTYGKDYHYVILYDVTTGKQLDSVKVSNTASGTSTNNVYNSANSKFTASLNYSGLSSLSDQIAIVSRYSDSSEGNGGAGNYVDHWFNLNNTNRANLDSFNLSNGSTVEVSGWNATDNSVFANAQYIILYDNTAQRQVAVKKVTSVNRADVAKAYSDYVNAAQSGFSTSFDSSLLTKGHNYSVVSRYSLSTTGNGDDGTGSYVDNWMGNITLNGYGYSIDSIKQTANGVQITGWMADNATVDGETNPYIIMLVNGKEVSRQKVTLTKRTDVAKAYSQVNNSLNSGFNVTFNIDSSQIDGNIQFVIRFSDSADGEGNHSDQWTREYTSNAGAIDNFTIGDSTIHVSGWHAAMNAQGMTHEFIIITDLNGNELYRTELTGSQKNISRSDVAAAYPWIADANESGFSVDIPLSDSMQHKQIKVYHRYSNSADGNSDYVDFVTVESVNSGWQGNKYYDPYTGQMATGTVTIDGKTYTFDSNGNLMDKQQTAVDKALSVLGTAYVWGGNTPAGFDCSGLVQWAYGLSSSYRTTYQQQSLGTHHYDVYNAPLGALVFFGSDAAPYHVGISLGNGTFVHAPETGDVVKITNMAYYTPSFYVVL
ncbi:NlpC/P60 family protein [Limosilactobacillus caecicola]|uniref:NlpC/P60 family protein n=1 Tax=Limosilactobacillus caecicola TaxID=2941332 RepID=UPI00203FD24B|nr:NlpC/P60 family protein [Limosilactobacillus caecicola]